MPNPAYSQQTAVLVAVTAPLSAQSGNRRLADLADLPQSLRAEVSVGDPTNGAFDISRASVQDLMMTTSGDKLANAPVANVNASSDAKGSPPYFEVETSWWFRFFMRLLTRVDLYLNKL